MKSNFLRLEKLIALRPVRRTLLGVGIAALLAMTSGDRASASGAAPVIVTNSSVPVHATQAGPWTVAVAGNPIVQVSSSTSAPIWTRDSDNPKPLQTFLCIGTGSLASGCGAIPGSYTISGGGVRQVIEQVSGTCAQDGTTQTQVIDVELRTQAGTVSVNHTFPLQVPPQYFGSPSGQFATAFNYPTRIYVDPDSQVSLIAVAFAGAGTDAFCRVAVSGYLANSYFTN